MRSNPLRILQSDNHRSARRGTARTNGLRRLRRWWRVGRALPLRRTGRSHLGPRGMAARHRQPCSLRRVGRPRGRWTVEAGNLHAALGRASRPRNHVGPRAAAPGHHRCRCNGRRRAALSRSPARTSDGQPESLVNGGGAGRYRPLPGNAKVRFRQFLLQEPRRQEAGRRHRLHTVGLESVGLGGGI